jgi:maleate isomerase
VGTGLATVRLIDELEEQHGKPVVATNAALYWHALRETGIDAPLAGVGRLGGL